MKTVYLLFTAFVLLLGFVHTAYTPFAYANMTLDAVWFAGAGMGLIYLSILNLFRIHTREAWMKGICIVANLTGSVWIVWVLLSFDTIPVQATLAVCCFAGMTIGSIGYQKKMS